MPFENKIVSSQEVALAAGVSRTLVSWVVNGTAAQHRVTKVTEQRVKVAVAQLNYEPGRFLGRKELLSESPAGSLSSTTKQPDNLITLLSSSGYRLVPVQSKADLAAATTEGLVGLVYRDSRVASSELRGGGDAPRLAGAAMPVVSHVGPRVVTAVPAVVCSDVRLGTHAAGPSTPLRAGTAASTLAAEPETAPLPETPAPTHAPVLPASPSATEQPNNLTTAPQAPPASPPETPHLNPLPQGERKEELTAVAPEAAEPEVETPAPPPSTTEQPNNLTTAPEPAPAPDPVAEVAPPVSPVFEVAADVPAAEAASAVQPGSNAADTAATTEEVQSGAPVVTAVPAVVSSEDQPGTNAAETSASTLVAEPEIEIPAPSPQQPSNPTTLSSSTLVAELVK
jgi:hypothetical protein